MPEGHHRTHDGKDQSRLCAFKLCVGVPRRPTAPSPSRSAALPLQVLWQNEIVPDLKAGKVVLIAAHGNSLRGLVKHLDGISDDDIVGLNLPTG